jgi:hypothetical protein
MACTRERFDESWKKSMKTFHFNIQHLLVIKISTARHIEENAIGIQIELYNETQLSR